MKLSPRGPGIAKAGRPPLVSQKTMRLVTSSDARWAELFEKADIVSEGAPRDVGSKRSYFGSTDIVLLAGQERPRSGALDLASIAAYDPHVRLRAVRMARREAAQRAGGPLDRLHAEITVSRGSRGVTVHVEVEAYVFPDRRAVPRAAVGAPAAV
jgi:hypothetical protein